MKINNIESSSNALLKRIRGLHERKHREKERRFLVEGERAIEEAIRKKLRLEEVVVSQSFLQAASASLSKHNIAEVSVVEDKVFKELAATTTPAGIIAVAEMPDYSFKQLFARDKTLIVVANGIQDPGNLGTMMRTALAASASGMILVKGTVDPFNPKVVRAAMGALFALPLVWDVSFEDTLNELKGKGLRIIACDASASNHVFDADLTGSVALIFGNEANGMPAAELAMADEVISIPMNPASESLNVAVSSAVVLFNVVQQRIKSQVPR